MTGAKTAYLGFGTWVRIAVDLSPENYARVSVLVADGNDRGISSDFRHTGDLTMSHAEAAMFAGLLHELTEPDDACEGSP